MGMSNQQAVSAARACTANRQPAYVMQARLSRSVHGFLGACWQQRELLMNALRACNVGPIPHFALGHAPSMAEFGHGICASSARPLQLVLPSTKDMSNLYIMFAVEQGGFKAWADAGLPVVDGSTDYEASPIALLADRSELLLASTSSVLSELRCVRHSSCGSLLINAHNVSIIMSSE